MPKKGERTWTDEQLRDAVASSKTVPQVLRKLGMSSSGRDYYRVQGHIDRLALDTSHFRRSNALNMDERLRELVPRSSTISELLGALELPEHDADRVRRRAKILGLSTKHFSRPSERGTKRTRWTDDQLRAAVASSFGIAATLRALGLVPAGGNYDAVQRRISALGIATSHFRGQAWNKGLRQSTRPALPLSDVLVANRWTTTHGLKQRLIREGLKAAHCELCGWAQCRALDGAIPLELDHINGDKNDNRLENLRVLCPNCHALQPTHRGLNQKRRHR